MVFQYIVGGVVASLLAFVLLFSVRGKKTTRASMDMTRNGSVKTLENGLCRSEIAGSTDVIIVGAGVAGAALAYTLGKVMLYFLFSLYKRVFFSINLSYTFIFRFMYTGLYHRTMIVSLDYELHARFIGLWI